MSSPFDRLNRILGGSLLPPFSDISALETAMTHRSFGRDHNERLEFLGDSVLGLVMTELLYRRFPESREGQLTRMRAHLVNKTTLARVARHLKLDQFIRLGRGERKNAVQTRDSVLSDALEAVTGALYLQKGYADTDRYVCSWFDFLLADLSLQDSGRDAKTQLKEWLDACQLQAPEYRLLREEARPAGPRFFVVCRGGDPVEEAGGEGSSRRLAEQQAAEALLERLCK